MKKIILLIALTLTMSIAALSGCSSKGTMNGSNISVPENAQQIVQNTPVETALGDESDKDKDCDDGRCENVREGENRREPDLHNDETDENKLPEHRHRPPHGPKKGRRHDDRPMPRPMPGQYR